MSYNRLRKITRLEVNQYSNLRILYLAENFLFNLENDIFVDLRYLTVLDLSMNDITKIPDHIFQLPSLEKLFLRQNLNMNLDDALDNVKTILSPLILLDISFTTDDSNVPEFPKLGKMPFLHTLNITGNMYSLMLPKHFAGLCKLSVLISANVTGAFDDPCDCWKINEWLMQRSVVFIPLKCPGVKRSKFNIKTLNPSNRVFKEKHSTYPHFSAMVLFFVIMLVAFFQVVHI